MSSADIRKIMNLMELDLAPSEEPARDAAGRVMHQDVSYEVSTTKVVAQLNSYQSQSYTKLGQKLQRIETLEKEIKTLKEETKVEVKERIADLFSAEDIVRTRVIETISFTFELTKNPKATESYKYAEIIKELESHLTPELITVLTEIKGRFKTSTQKSPALTTMNTGPVATESQQLEEGFWDKLTAWAAKFKSMIMNWSVKYESQLDNLRAKAASVQESIAAEASKIDLGGFMGVGRPDTQMAKHRELMMREDGELEKAMTGAYTALTDVYPSGNTEIWYAKPEFTRDSMMGFNFLTKQGMLPDAADLEQNYVKLGTVQDTDLPTVYEMMQGEAWSPRGQARGLIKGMGLSHTSMSVGDVIVVDGAAFMVDSVGFKRLPNKGEVTAEDFTSAPDMAWESIVHDYDAAIQEGGESEMAFHVGDTVYCGSRSGVLLSDQLPSHPELLLVQLSNGDRNVFPKDKTTAKKPGMMSRTASWIVGEGDESSDLDDNMDTELDEEVEARDLVWTTDYTTWFENAKRLAGLPIVKREKYEIWVENPRDSENPISAAQWQPAKRQGYIDVSVLPVISKKLVRNEFSS